MHRFAWRSKLYRRLWYWYVFKFLCPPPGRHMKASDW